MLALHPEYVVNERRETRAVVIPLNEWRQILDLIEELEDIRAYDDAKTVPGEYIPFEQAIQEIQHKNVS